MSRTTTTVTETPDEFVARFAVLPRWAEEVANDARWANDTVTVVRQSTFAGTFVVDAQPTTEREAWEAMAR